MYNSRFNYQLSILASLTLLIPPHSLSLFAEATSARLFKVGLGERSIINYQLSIINYHNFHLAFRAVKPQLEFSAVAHSYAQRFLPWSRLGIF